MEFEKPAEKEINKATQEMVLDNFDDKEGIDERLFQDLGDNFSFDSNKSGIKFFSKRFKS